MTTHNAVCYIKWETDKEAAQQHDLKTGKEKWYMVSYPSRQKSPTAAERLARFVAIVALKKKKKLHSAVWTLAKYSDKVAKLATQEGSVLVCIQ